MNKNETLLKYVIHKHLNPSITVLMKIMYLIDLYALKKIGQKISGYKYIRYTYGPYSKDLYDDLDLMVDKKSLFVEGKFSGPYEFSVYTIEENEVPCVEDIFSPEELTLIDTMLGDLQNYSAKTLTDIAYKTEPMVKLKATLGGDENLYEELI